jgi:ParB-like chromosome segregation protein Spo0J
MFNHEELERLFKDSDYDSQDWNEWKADIAVEVLRKFSEEDVIELKRKWKTQTTSWKLLLVSISDELPEDVFVSIVLEILATEEDEDLSWEAAVRCGFNARHRDSVVRAIKEIGLSFREECIKKLDLFISKGYGRTGNEDEIPLLKNLLLEIGN